MNRLILGDNLGILRSMPAESVDLIYLDPPFFSNRNYEVIWGDKGEVASFEDRWSGGVDHYIAWLKERVVEMHRILKPSGAIFLHCDWHASAYIRVLILDKIFGINNFRSEIVWQRTNAHNDAKQGRKALGNVTDTIWYYTKSSSFTFHHQYSPYTDDYISKFYKYSDEDGRKYRLSDITAPGGGIPGKGNPFYELMGIKRYWRFSQDKAEEMVKAGLIVQLKPGNVPLQKRYLDEMKGVALQNLWTDIPNIQFNANERIGYPTQKPLALLDRIVQLTSNEGDVVLDPFVGGGTSVVVAEKLKRQWIGIDQSVTAIKLTEMRLQKGRDVFSQKFEVVLGKYSYDALRYSEAFGFEAWIVEQLGGQANKKQRGDMGIDGRTAEGMPIQVKRSDNVGRVEIDKFLSACKRFDSALFEYNKAEKKPIGLVVAFSFGKGAIQEIARLKNTEGVIIELRRVEEIVPVVKGPVLKVDYTDEGQTVKGLQLYSFNAQGESATGINFYAWDWNHEAEKGFSPQVLMDKTGQQSREFEPGTHTIAVKVVDNEGLEAMELLGLQVDSSE